MEGEGEWMDWIEYISELIFRLGDGDAIETDGDSWRWTETDEGT